MSIFANKDTFLGLGVEKVEASPAHMSQDCSICTKPLAVHHKDSSPQSTLRGFHQAVRVIVCGHIHGSDCLSAWLSVGNTCPTCKRILFEGDKDKITQDDVNEIVHTLGPLFGEARIMGSIANMMNNQEQAHAMARRYHEQAVTQQQQVQNQQANDSEFMLNDDDFLVSDEEMDDDEDQDEEDEEYFDDGGFDDE